jgi:hypothetical protein
VKGGRKKKKRQLRGCFWVMETQATGDLRVRMERVNERFGFLSGFHGPELATKLISFFRMAFFSPVACTRLIRLSFSLQFSFENSSFWTVTWFIAKMRGSGRIRE